MLTLKLREHLYNLPKLPHILTQVFTVSPLQFETASPCHVDLRCLVVFRIGTMVMEIREFELDLFEWILVARKDIILPYFAVRYDSWLAGRLSLLGLT